MKRTFSQRVLSVLLCVAMLLVYMPGYTNDPSLWCVHFAIGYNADTGALVADAKYINDTTVKEHAPIFNNYYEAKPVTYAPQVKKSFEGGDMLTYQISYKNYSGLDA